MNSCTAAEEITVQLPEGEAGEVTVQMPEGLANKVTVQLAEGDAGEVAMQLPEGEAGAVAVQLLGGVDVESACPKNEEGGKYLPQLMLAIGIGAITLGLQEIISPPSTTLFKHVAFVMFFYAAHVLEIILGAVQLILFVRWLKTAGVERRRCHQMGKLVMGLTLLPVLITVTLVYCAKFK